jgi:xylan 1,4-beta-xylosidase
MINHLLREYPLLWENGILVLDTPFHGGYGIFTVNSIPKSSYNAFKLLNEVGGGKIELVLDNKADNCGVITSYSKDTNIINILLYNYVEPGQEKLTSENFEINIEGIKGKKAAYKSLEINENRGSAYEWWRKIGAPDFLTVESMQFLTEKSKMEECCKVIGKERGTELFKLEETIKPGDVKLIQIYNFV